YHFRRPEAGRDADAPLVVGPAPAYCFRPPAPLTGEAARRLVEAAFAGDMADGTPPGGYVLPQGQAVPFKPREFDFELLGGLAFVEVVKAAGTLGVPCTSPSPAW